MDILAPFVKKMSSADVPALESMIANYSWWDTVDALVSNMIGPIFKKNHEIRDQYVSK